MRMRTTTFTIAVYRMNWLGFLVFFGLIREIEPTNGNSKPWPWSSLQPPFPKPVLYDTGLSKSFKVSVYLRPRGRRSPVSVEFTFLEPSEMQCNMTENSDIEFNYTLVLQGKESKYPRHVGPYHGKACDRSFQVDVVDLRKDSEYKAYIVVYNGSTSLKSDQLYFSTTDVQWAHVVKESHRALITCHFALGTRAKGCRIAAQVMNTQMSAQVKTRHFIIRRSYGVNEASKCIKLDDRLSLGSVEVVDWKENGELGAIRVATAIEESRYTPCFIEPPMETNYSEATGLLYVTSVVLFLSGAVLVMISITMSSCKYHFRLKRQSCKLDKRNFSTPMSPSLSKLPI